mmetsp:Transcript_39309/g.95113  ORF Transcript_39309/g.95113 Transcript_39309/m.95113 type:complete len:380 (+) Transcript_39309:651-1790(+)
MLILSKACDLTSGSHLHTKVGISTTKTSEREHRSLDTDVVNVQERNLVWLDIQSSHRLGSKRDEVVVQSLADKWESTTGTQVALNTLDLVSLGHELDVEGTSDSKGLGNGSSVLLDLLDGSNVKLLSWKHNCCVSTVDTGILQVLSNGVVEDFSLVGNGIEFDLLGILDELGNNNRLVSRDISSKCQEIGQLGLGSGDTHCRSRQDETWSDQDWVSNIVGKLNGFLLRVQYRPLGLIDTHIVQHLGELVTIFGTLNISGIGSQNIGSTLMQGTSKVVGDLSTDRNNNTGRVLRLVDIHDTLQTQLLKVQTVGFIVISTDSLGVVVDDDTLESITLQLTDTRHSTPIEFDTGTNAVGTTSKDNDTTFLGGEHFVLAVSNR